MAVGSSNSFDLIVLGGGTGGYSAAFRAGQLGLKVALIDDQPRLGGTCLIWGCIPTKAMLELAELYERMQHGADFGVPVEGLRFDYPTVAKRRDQIVDATDQGRRRSCQEEQGRSSSAAVARSTAASASSSRRSTRTASRMASDRSMPLTSSSPRARASSLCPVSTLTASASSPATRRRTATRCPRASSSSAPARSASSSRASITTQASR